MTTLRSAVLILAAIVVPGFPALAAAPEACVSGHKPPFEISGHYLRHDVAQVTGSGLRRELAFFLQNAGYEHHMLFIHTDPLGKRGFSRTEIGFQPVGKDGSGLPPDEFVLRQSGQSFILRHLGAPGGSSRASGQ